MKLVNKLLEYIKGFIQMYNNVHKTLVLQPQFKKIYFDEYNLNSKKLLTLNT